MTIINHLKFKRYLYTHSNMYSLNLKLKQLDPVRFQTIGVR